MKKLPETRSGCKKEDFKEKQQGWGNSERGEGRAEKKNRGKKRDTAVGKGITVQEGSGGLKGAVKTSGTNESNLEKEEAKESKGKTQRLRRKRDLNTER